MNPNDLPGYFPCQNLGPQEVLLWYFQWDTYPNKTLGSMKREKKSQDRKRRMRNKRLKEMVTTIMTMDLQVVLLAPRA